jgi:hypothetical protein
MKEITKRILNNYPKEYERINQRIMKEITKRI